MQGIATLEKREEITSLTNDERALLRTYWKEIQELYKPEEIMWCLRVRSKWLKVGDTNTTYFQNIANMRYRINAIHSLNTLEGGAIVGEDLKTHTHEYF